MIKKLKCNKLLKISSITVGSSINTFCAEEEIVLDENSFITVDCDTTSLKDFKLKKNNKEIRTIKDLSKYFLDNFSDFKFNNVDDIEDVRNGKTLDEVFNLKESFNNNKLFIININDKESFNDVEDDNKKILDDVFTNSKLCLSLKTHQKVSIINNSPYKLLNNEFQKKLENVNNEIKSYFNVGQIKDLMASKGFKREKISISDDKKEFEDDAILYNADISVNYNDDIYNKLEPKTAKIEFIAGDGLVLAENVKTHKINFVEDGINEDTTIFNFITNKFTGLSSENCKIEYLNNEDNTWYDVKEGDRFEDEDKIRITINAEVKDFTIKKNTQNPPKNDDKQNQDESDSGSGNKKEQGCCGKCSGGNKN